VLPSKLEAAVLASLALLQAAPALADVPPMPDAQCATSKAGDPCKTDAGKAGKCTYGAPDRAGRSALRCLEDGAAPAPSSAPSAAPSSAPAPKSGCAVGGEPSGGFAAAALLGLAVLVARRRR
jgi:MYXO-CTERM domain-containing protein